jgi:hypothetical protein
MRAVIVAVTMIVNDDTRPEKWVADAIAMSLEPGEELVGVSILSDEYQKTSQES